MSWARQNLTALITRADLDAGGVETSTASGEVMFMMEEGLRWQSRPSAILPGVPAPEEPKRISATRQLLPRRNRYQKEPEGSEQKPRSPALAGPPGGNLSWATMIGHQDVSFPTLISSAESKPLLSRTVLPEKRRRRKPYSRFGPGRAPNVICMALISVPWTPQMPLGRLGNAQPQRGPVRSAIGFASNTTFCLRNKCN